MGKTSRNGIINKTKKHSIIMNEAEKERINSIKYYKTKAEKDSNELKKQWVEDIEKFYELMHKFGWPPHIEMNVLEARRIVRASRNYKNNELEQAINEYYIEKYSIKVINNMLNKWGQSEVLEKRIPILEQVISAHIGGDYFLSTCTMISQLEGIIADSENHIGKMGGPDIKKYLTSRIVGKERYSFSHAYRKFYDKKLYCTFEHGKRIVSAISRNAILHGADIGYGTEVNSLKVILIFDSLFYYFV